MQSFQITFRHHIFTYAIFIPMPDFGIIIIIIIIIIIFSILILQFALEKWKKFGQPLATSDFI